MTITRAKIPPKQLDGFIASAPDSKAAMPSAPGLKTKRGNQRSQVSVVLPDAVLARLDVAAESRYMSRSALLTMLINQFLNEGQSLP